MALVLKISKVIEKQIDEFLELVSESGIIFKKAVNNYLKEEWEEFNKNIALVNEYEHKADELREEIETQLYLKTLIPDNRSDVMAILENTDNVIDSMKATILSFSVEKPDIPPKLDVLFYELTESSVQSVEWLIRAIKSFFTDLKAVNDLIGKVTKYEKETDDISVKLKRMIFKEDLELSQKMHLRYFVNNIEQISNFAELASDRLAIYTIKRFV